MCYLEPFTGGGQGQDIDQQERDCIFGSSLLRTRLAGEQGKVRTGAKTGFQLRRLPVRSQGGQGQTHTRVLADLNRQDIIHSVRSGVPGPAVHVPHRASISHRKASPPRSTSTSTFLILEPPPLASPLV